MSKFERKAFDANSIAEIGDSGRGRFEYKIKGFWSCDSFTVYANVRTDFVTDEYTVEVEFSRSSGGRDPKEVKCEITANENYAAAMMDGAELAREIKSKEKEIIESYAYHMDWRRALQEEYNRNAEAELAKDPAIGEEKAAEIVDSLYKAEEDNAIVVTYRNNSREVYVMRKTENGRKRFVFNGGNVSKAGAVKAIAKMSAKRIESIEGVF